MKQIKKISIFISLFAVLLTIGGCALPWTEKAPAVTGADTAKQEISAKLFINTGAGTHEYSETLPVGSTALDFLRLAGDKGGFAVEVKDSSLGAFVEGIYGIKNESEAGKYWMYKVNGELAQVGAGEYKLKDGDRIDWQFGGWEEEVK